MTCIEDLPRTWGELIRAARTQMGLSLEVLAERAGMDTSHLSRAERGLAGVGDDSRIRLAAALGQRVEDLFPYPDTSQDSIPCPSASSAAAPASPASSPTTPMTPTPTGATHPSARPAGSATAPAPSTPTATPSGDAR